MPPAIVSRTKAIRVRAGSTPSRSPRPAATPATTRLVRLRVSPSAWKPKLGRPRDGGPERAGLVLGTLSRGAPGWGALVWPVGWLLIACCRWHGRHLGFHLRQWWHPP